MRWVTAMNLQQWADTLQARTSFPALVADLTRVLIHGGGVAHRVAEHWWPIPLDQPELPGQVRWFVRDWSLSKLLVRLFNFSSGCGIKRRRAEKPGTFTGIAVVHPMKVFV